MALSLVIFIGIHEYGHVWQMKRCGIKTRGMFFLPGIGAVAVADEQFKTASNEAYIAIMGPVFGLIGFVLPMVGWYLYTHEPIWAAIAAFTAFINMVNLFPVYPLDGGRMVKALAYTENAQRSFMIIVIVSVLAAATGMSLGLFLIVLMACVGFWEVTKEFGISEKIPNALSTMFRVLFIALILYLTGWFGHPHAKPPGQVEHVPAVGLALLALVGLVVMVIMAVYDVVRTTVGQTKWIFMYPYEILVSAYAGFREIVQLRLAHIQDIPEYARMENQEKISHAIFYVALIMLHAILIFQLGKVPGAEFAVDLLK